MKTRRNMLIIGGTGFVGSSVARAFVKDFNITSTFRKPYTPIAGVTYQRVDTLKTTLDQKENAKSLVQRVDPDVVVFCAGSNDVHFCEQDRNFQMAQVVHAGFVNNLVPAIDTIKAKLIYLSSDYLFSGIDGNFGETDASIPSSQLGKAKLSAENFIRNRAMNYVILRCAPLLGRGPLDHPSWLDLIRENLLRGKKVKLPLHEIHNPVPIPFMIEAIRKVIDEEIRNKTFHIGGLSRISSYELMKNLAEKMGLSSDLIDPSDAESQTAVADYSLNFTDTLKVLKLMPESIF